MIESAKLGSGLGSLLSKKRLPRLGGKLLVVLLSATALTPWDAFGQTTTWIGTVGSPTGDRWGVNEIGRASCRERVYLCV